MNNENIESMDIEPPPPPPPPQTSSSSSSIYSNYNKEELKLWVSSLPDEVTESELREFFSKYSINEIKLIESPGTQKQSALVTFFDKESANRAREELSQQLFKNQRLKINLASVKPQKYYDNMTVSTPQPLPPPTATTVAIPPHHPSQIHTKTIHIDPYNSLGHYGTGIHHHYTHPQPPQTFSTGYHSVYYGNKDSSKDNGETNNSVNSNNKTSPTTPTTISPPTTSTLVSPHQTPHQHQHQHPHPFSHPHHPPPPPPPPIPIPLHHHHHHHPPPPPPTSHHHHSLQHHHHHNHHHPKIITDNDPYVNKKLFLGSLNDEPEEEMRYRFSRYGEIDCFDLTSKGVAFVRYLKTESAIMAKRDLGYRYKIQYDKREPRDHYHFDPNGPSSFISGGASQYYGPDYYPKHIQQQPPPPPLSSSTSSLSSSSSHPLPPPPPLPSIPPSSSTFYNEPLSTEEYNQFLLFLEKLQPIRSLIKESKDWFILHLKSGKPIIQLMSKYVNNQLTLVTVQNKIEIIYLINDILYFGVSRRGNDHSDQISDLFEPFLPSFITSFSKEPIQTQQKLLHVLDIWESRYYYPYKIIQHYKNLLK
ncbi:hypothetical protein ACTFIU_008881 [Dictyostelium citrinum]